ncbi:hypothetical protein D7V97_00600 [Corallococcus sp. CA053C]|uniref:anti-phage dCTP deaminase n=1 Tax=Corallococcus sp. CA053C TaxID=2316732 RepID=UPI000EA3E68D|nr:anti-phage dCTP deaminase [Corallococcus sp. CA053C]RKH15337.1 hypothetical protein D7V97_00600 [Corallococcus sp. CA053C]
MTAIAIPSPPLRTSDSKDHLRDAIDDAKSHDLVFAIVGHVGAGATHVAGSLIEELTSAGYKPLKIKASTLITETADQLGLIRKASLSGPRHERTKILQDAGDQLRKDHGASIVAALAIRRIHDERKQPRTTKQPLAFVIDSLKHPREVETLREVYRSSFYLIGVICGFDVREKRLVFKYKDTDSDNRADIAARDDAAPRTPGQPDIGQNVRGTLQYADFFVNNEDQDPRSLAGTLSRTIQIITERAVIRPHEDERGMYAAWSSALRSSCMSRQVGAAIMSKTGELIATGTNDVPKYGGGLYQDGDPVDHRCFMDKGDLDRPYCRNDHSKIDIYKNIFQRLKSNNLLSDGVSPDAVRQQIEQTAVRDLIEFSRAVHAEMDAILSVARLGNATTQGATLYCTTYPCHSCARHIVASGIREVVYIEPYVKSRASTLHSDSTEEVTKRWSDSSKKVHFRPFSGVSPRRFSVAFKKIADLKDRDGFLISRPSSQTVHHDPVFSKDLIDFEAHIAERVEEIERGRDSHGR